MADFLLRAKGWWTILTYGDLLWAAVYGGVAGGLAASAYAWFSARRKNRRLAQLRAKPCRYLRLPYER